MAWKRGSWGWHIPRLPSNVSAPSPQARIKICKSVLNDMFQWRADLVVCTLKSCVIAQGDNICGQGCTLPNTQQILATLAPDWQLPVVAILAIVHCFCTPKRCTRVQYLVLKNNPNYDEFLDEPDTPLTFEWPTRACYLEPSWFPFFLLFYFFLSQLGETNHFWNKNGFF